MATTASRPKLVVIVGPTASGKSNLALGLAKKFNGEIIAADSRTIYKGMDIGTAKPTAQERQQIRHWGLDLVEPGEPFSAYKFKKYAQEAITNIQRRGRLPILVGGTGLYIDAVLFDFGFVPRTDPNERQKLEKLTTQELEQIIRDKDYQMPVNSQNRRHLIRTIERKGEVGDTKGLKANLLIIGLLPDDETLRARINKRVEEWFERGLIEEASRLFDKYGHRWLSFAGIGYGAVVDYVEGTLTEQEAEEIFKSEHWQYARRQRTWFRRNKFIQWYKSSEEAFTAVSHLLNK